MARVSRFFLWIAISREKSGKTRRKNYTVQLMQITSSQLRQKYLDFSVQKITPLSHQLHLCLKMTLRFFQYRWYAATCSVSPRRKASDGDSSRWCTKCVRTGDIDDVGDDTHHTFLRCSKLVTRWLFKAWFYRDELGIPYITWLARTRSKDDFSDCLEGDANAPRDDESAKIWMDLGMPAERIAYLAAEG